MAFELFGFKIERKSQESPKANVPAFTLPENDDGLAMVSGANAYGSFVTFNTNRYCLNNLKFRGLHKSL